MKSTKSCVLVIAALVTTAAVQVPRDATPPPDAASQASLRGVVVDEKRQPVGGAIMMLRGGPMPGVTTTVTDVNGTFAFVGLPAGVFSLTASRSGYPTVEYGQTRPYSIGTRIVLSARQRAAITVRMPRGAVIAGVVLDEGGTPLVGQRVSASRAQPPSDPADVREWSARTDRAGRYRIATLSAGTYVVTAQRIMWSYFEGDRPRSEAARVTLSVGQVRDKVDLRVAPPVVQMAPVKVTPTFPPGGFHRSLELRVFSDDRHDRVGSSCLRDPDGSCTFSNVPGGRHTIVATTRETPVALWGAAEFTSDGKHPTAVSLTLEPGVRIAGRMRFDGTSSPPQNMVIRVVPEDDDSIYGAMIPINASARIVFNEVDWPSVPQGRYRLSIASDLAPWTIESAMHGGVDLLDVPVDVTSAGLDGIALVFTDAPTELSGVVRRGSAPRVGVELIAYATEPRLWRSARRILTMRSDSDGRYTLRGLPPGAYHVAQVPPALADSPADAEVLAKLKHVATVTLARGEHRTCDLVFPASATK
jgi:protocatechuate 3,4-dioxygenase beta subunit